MATPLENFESVVRRLEYTRRKVDRLYASDEIVDRDVRVIYGGLFMQLFTSFEAFLEATFYGILLGRLSYPSARDVTARIATRSAVVAREVVLGEGRQYVDWMPFERCVERANVYLRGGRPFDGIPVADRQSMNRAHFTRNALAHASEHSRKTFENRVLVGHALLPSERNPVAFLRSRVGGEGSSTQFEIFQGDLRKVANALSP